MGGSDDEPWALTAGFVKGIWNYILFRTGLSLDSLVDWGAFFFFDEKHLVKLVPGL